MKEQSIEALVNRFTESARNHSAATLQGDYRAANREAGLIHRCYLEIRSRGPEAREALLKVALNGDPEVAGLAASYSLHYDSGRAVQVLSRLAKGEGIMAFKAQQTLKRWESGEWTGD